MISALLALSLLAAPDATPSPSPTATPPPSQEGPDAYEREPDEAAPDLEPLPSPTPYRPDLPDVALVPSIGIGGHVSEDAHGRDLSGMHFWAGVHLHPAPSDLGPFMGVGVSLDAVSYREGAKIQDGPVYVMPEMRYGVAFLSDPRKYESAMFPAASIYAIAGWRPERGTDDGLLRLGGGIGSPMLFAFGMEEACLPIPSTIEFAIDAPDGKLSGPRARSTFRAGWQF